MTPEDPADRIGEMIREHSAQVAAPQRLRATIAASRAAPRRRLAAWRPLRSAAAVCAVVAVGLAVAIAWPAGQPDVNEAAALALRPNTPDAVAIDSVDPRYLDMMIGKVRFPAYGYGIEAVGGRRDKLGDRRAVTVRYATGEGDVGHTVVSGTGIDVPQNARAVRRGALEAKILRSDGALIVVWRRAGQTCVLASRTADEDLLLTMASYV
jgi:hypothetical protein